MSIDWGETTQTSLGEPTADVLTDIADGEQPLILVDHNDCEVGTLNKRDCHAGHGQLHRAFSLFILNGRDQLLLQQRGAGKRLWPGFWSNSCCSHPRQGESLQDATHRRLYEELGIRCALKFLFKFEYQAQYDASGAEHELCSVYVGRSDAPVHANAEEIAAWRSIDVDELQREMTGSGRGQFTPWFQLEWARLWRDHRNDILTSKMEGAWASR